MQGEMSNGPTATSGPEMNATGTVDAGGIIDEVKSAAREVADGAKEQVQGLKEQVSERATGTVNEKKHALADSLESLVTALRAAEKALRDDSQESLATYSSSLASYVERSTGYIRNNDMSGLMNDMQKVGRENTGMFMGGTFVAGAALGRFLRASEPAAEMGDSAAQNDGAPRSMGDASSADGASR